MRQKMALEELQNGRYHRLRLLGSGGMGEVYLMQDIRLDVKPSNFLLRRNTKNPTRPTLLLADFGIARSSATAASSSRTVRGTPTTMAPEQWSSMPVPASDQYALAVMVYELLAGR